MMKSVIRNYQRTGLGIRYVSNGPLIQPIHGLLLKQYRNDLRTYLSHILWSTVTCTICIDNIWTKQICILSTTNSVTYTRKQHYMQNGGVQARVDNLLDAYQSEQHCTRKVSGEPNQIILYNKMNPKHAQPRISYAVQELN